MMRRTLMTAAMLALSLPGQGMAGEAYLAQITAGPMTVTVPQPAVVQALPEMRLQIMASGLVSGSDAALPDLSDFPVARPDPSGAIAEVRSVGSSNRSLLVQTGVQAGTIRQTGSLNTASLVQSGAMNGASIYQATNGASASVIQIGHHNRALVVSAGAPGDRPVGRP